MKRRMRWLGFKVAKGESVPCSAFACYPSTSLWKITITISQSCRERGLHGGGAKKLSSLPGSC